MAKSFESVGADGLSIINTLTGMQIHLPSRKPLIANKTGGLSGPAIKPIAIRMIYEVRQQVSIPIIGMGGITSAEDVLEFMLAGASDVAVGIGNFQNSFICSEVITELPHILNDYGCNSVNDVIGNGTVAL